MWKLAAVIAAIALIGATGQTARGGSTPEAQFFLIKENDVTYERLAGWEMTVYAGESCFQVNLITGGVTDQNGVYASSSLPVGSYSVAEGLQPGWVNVTPICQDVMLPESGVNVRFANVPLPAGDVNCDGAVSSIDAALVLQRTAGFLTSLSCEEVADVNGDGQIGSIDAALILQFTAGFLDSLPT